MIIITYLRQKLLYDFGNLLSISLASELLARNAHHFAHFLHALGTSLRNNILDHSLYFFLRHLLWEVRLYHIDLCHLLFCEVWTIL